MEAILALEDGRWFRARSVGARGEQCGEVVFNTAMTGYQEVLTDPSYRAQIVVMTCPQIGNYGVNGLDDESGAPQVAGLVVREASLGSSNWRATQEFLAYLREHGTPAITEVDTRALTRHLRSRGAMRGAISSLDLDPQRLVAKALGAAAPADVDLVAEVTTRAAYAWAEPRGTGWTGSPVGGSGPQLSCVAYDYGIKRNILRLLHEAGFGVTVVPASTPAADTLALRPDAVLLSNGPGDPTTATYAIRTVRELAGRVPLFGICLGHQIAALALGGRTYKLKFGHRGANHPVRDLRTGRVAITSQNHGYAVDPQSLPQGVEATHVNLNDQTLEGFAQAELGVFAVQYHPEASPGPHDSHRLFAEFRELALLNARATGLRG